jgi:hypothetical protein
MKKYGGVDVQIHVLLTLALVTSWRCAVSFRHLTLYSPPWETSSGTNWMGS